jgi:hypothetical protein
MEVVPRPRNAAARAKVDALAQQGQATLPGNQAARSRSDIRTRDIRAGADSPRLPRIERRAALALAIAAACASIAFLCWDTMS